MIVETWQDFYSGTVRRNGYGADGGMDSTATSPEDATVAVAGDSNDRIISLSDGVFAFAMTLMVLQLRTPDPATTSSGELRESITSQWPALLSYGLTFYVIATYWLVHHRLFRFIRGHDGGLVWMNVFFLFIISFLPFPTEIMGEYSDVSFASAFYAISMAIASLMVTVMWLYVSHRPHLLVGPVTPGHFRYNLLRGIGVATIFLVSAVIAQWSPAVARLFWLVLVPFHRILAYLYRGSIGGSFYA